MLKLRICYTSRYTFENPTVDISALRDLHVSLCAHQRVKYMTASSFSHVFTFRFGNVALHPTHKQKKKNLTEIVAPYFNISVSVTVENCRPFLVNNPVHVNKASPILKASRCVLLEYRAVTAY